MLNTAIDLETTVLYVAKDNVVRAVRTDGLRKAGLNVQEASTGREALANVDEKPDVILVDVDLPDLSGFEVCRRLKVDPGLAATPVLLMSPTFAEAQDRLQALAAGADDYLIEPVEAAELLDHIRNHLQVQRRESFPEISPQEP
jgi:DNA-binding response OmpR family regulator